MLNTRQFISLYVMNFFSIFLGLFVANMWKQYWNTLADPPSDKLQSTIGSIGLVFNGMRFIWSMLLDHYSYKSVYGSMLVLEILIAFTFPLVVNYTWIYVCYICIGYLCLGGHFTLLPNVCKQIFGDKATLVYSYLYTYAGVTGVAECLIQIFLMTSNNLEFFFYLYGGFSVISLILLIFWFDPTPYNNRTESLTDY